MANIVASTQARVAAPSEITIGIVLSIVSTSLLKRLMVRPSGVVSKKDMGSRMTLLIRWECRRRAADSSAANRQKEAITVNTAGNGRIVGGDTGNACGLDDQVATSNR